MLVSSFVRSFSLIAFVLPIKGRHSAFGGGKLVVPQEQFVFQIFDLFPKLPIVARFVVVETEGGPHKGVEFQELLGAFLRGAHSVGFRFFVPDLSLGGEEQPRLAIAFAVRGHVSNGIQIVPDKLVIAVSGAVSLANGLALVLIETNLVG